MFLGDQDTDPPYHYKIGYTVHTIEMPIFPAGTTFSNTVMGFHRIKTKTGFTNSNVTEDDVVLDQFGTHHKIVVTEDWATGATHHCRACSLEEMKDFPFTAGFFGFEDVGHGTIGYEFEDGFERGYWAL